MIALLALALALAALQPAPPPRDCQDDQGTDRCAEAAQQRMRALYAVRSIEEHRAAGDQVWRIFYVDGYGRDVVLISFVRAAGHDPTMWVHFPSDQGASPSEPLQAPVPQPLWNEVRSRSENFERTFAPEPGRDPSAIRLCLHGWVYAVESVGRRLGRAEAPVRRKVENACEDGPTAAYAQDIQRIALSLLPYCAALDPSHHRNPASTIAACRLLSGDRLAAAEVMNEASVFRSYEGPEGRARPLLRVRTAGPHRLERRDI